MKQCLRLLDPKGGPDATYPDIISLGLWFLKYIKFETFEEFIEQDKVSIMNQWRIKNPKIAVINAPTKKTEK